MARSAGGPGIPAEKRSADGGVGGEEASVNSGFAMLEKGGRLRERQYIFHNIQLWTAAEHSSANEVRDKRE